MRVQDVLYYSPIISSAISQDGRWVTIGTPQYVPTLEKRPIRLFLMDLDGKRRWVEIESGTGVEAIYAPCFAPDCARLLAFRYSNALTDAAIVDLEKPHLNPIPLLGLPPSSNALKWRGKPGEPACVGEDPQGIRRLWVWEAGNRLPTPITPEGQSVGDYAFSATGKRLAWLETPNAVHTGGKEQVLLHICNDDGTSDHILPLADNPLGYLAWSHDGQRLAFLARPGKHRLTGAEVMMLNLSDPPIQTTTLECLTEGLEGWISGFDWTPDGKSVVISIQQGTFGRIMEIGLDGTTCYRGPVDQFVSGPHMDRSLGRILYLQQSGEQPQSLRIYGPGFPRGKTLTRPSRRLSRTPLRPYELMTWKTKDHLEIEGLLMRPEGNPPFPTLVWIHGGPAEHVNQTFSPYFQVFASAGWAIFAPNFRGSTGRGNAFLRANVDDLCGEDAADVLRGIDRLVRKGIADPSQIAAMGWSYGGSLALAIAARSRRLASVVAVAPVVDWSSIFGAISYPALSGEYFSSEIWEDRKPYDRASPLTYIKRIRCPVLFLHGENDTRVPLSQSRLAYRILQQRGVETDFVVYEGENHVFIKPSAITDMLERVTEWTGKHFRA